MPDSTAALPFYAAVPTAATVAIDARDAYAQPLRGWGRYVAELLAAMPAHDAIRLRPVTRGWPGPEVIFEQVALPALLWRERSAVVHAPNCFLPLRRPCPGVVTVHDLAFEEFPEDFSPRTGWKYRTFTPRAARSAERVICVSAFTAADVVRRYGVDEAKVRVIPNAPSLPLGDRPTRGRKALETPYLLAVGDLRPKKNLERLVRAFRALCDEGLEHRLVLAGVDGGQGGRLAEAAGDASVDLVGYLPDADLDALMRGADALVHPSLYEGFGLVVVEAMARGVPVASSHATALPETAGQAALYFDPLDEQALAAALRSLLGDRALRERLSVAGRARAATFTWARTARETAAVYAQALAA